MELEKTITKEWHEFEDFAPGDVVRLKGISGPQMVVDNASSSRIICVWFDAGNVYHMRNFDQGAIEKVTKDPDLSPA
jgi:uncharacterized protein YodC (DUF2158 family)